MSILEFYDKVMDQAAVIVASKPGTDWHLAVVIAAQYVNSSNYKQPDGLLESQAEAIVEWVKSQPEIFAMRAGEIFSRALKGLQPTMAQSRATGILLGNLEALGVRRLKRPGYVRFKKDRVGP